MVHRREVARGIFHIFFQSSVHPVQPKRRSGALAESPTIARVERVKKEPLEGIIRRGRMARLQETREMSGRIT